MVSVGAQEMEGKCAHAHARTHACAWPSHAGTWAGLCERLYTASSAGPTTASMRARGNARNMEHGEPEHQRPISSGSSTNAASSGRGAPPREHSRRVQERTNMMLVGLLLMKQLSIRLPIYHLTHCYAVTRAI